MAEPSIMVEPQAAEPAPAASQPRAPAPALRLDEPTSTARPHDLASAKKSNALLIIVTLLVALAAIAYVLLARG